MRMICRLPQRVTVIHTRDRGDKAYGIHRLAILQVTEQVCHTLKVNSLTFEAVYPRQFLCCVVLSSPRSAVVDSLTIHLYREREHNGNVLDFTPNTVH